MKLTASEMHQLIASTDGRPLKTVIDDACELITAKLVLRLKAKQRAIKDRRAGLALGDPEANLLAAQMRALGEALVELAETP